MNKYEEEYDHTVCVICDQELGDFGLIMAEASRDGNQGYPKGMWAEMDMDCDPPSWLHKQCFWDLVTQEKRG